MVCFTYITVNTLQKGDDDDGDTNNKYIASHCILHGSFFFLLFSSLKGNLYFDLRHRSKPISAT